MVNNPLGIGPPPSGSLPDKGGIGQSGVSGPPLTPEMIQYVKKNKEKEK